MSDARLELSPDDDDHVLVFLDCGPMVPRHKARIPVRELENILTLARSRQLGVDVWGNL